MQLSTIPLPPGATIGIIGGGQLGRMLTLAAARLGFKTFILDPKENCPAGQVARDHLVADYDDPSDLAYFIEQVDLVTYEFENVPVTSAETALAVRPVYPGVLPLKTAQDRLEEKTFLSDNDIPVAPFQPVTNEFEARRAARTLGLPAVLKTCRFGYDGKGQVVIRDDNNAIDAFLSLKTDHAIMEAFVPFKREISVVAARSVTGETAAYPIIENAHENHILARSTGPAYLDNPAAAPMALKIMEKLDYVGVMATEFFELENGDLLVNEIAPRVHNSGHWTQDAGCVDQFELHIRAITGWPLGRTAPRHRVEMQNLIGEAVNDWAALAKEPDSFVHLYGKKEVRPGRKMGHVNRIID